MVYLICFSLKRHVFVGHILGVDRIGSPRVVNTAGVLFFIYSQPKEWYQDGGFAGNRISKDATPFRGDVDFLTGN